MDADNPSNGVLIPCLMTHYPSRAGQPRAHSHGKIEAHGDVGFAVVLLTPDDEGRQVNGTFKFRARQNVMFELGYFIDRLGRSNVCALTRGDVELPSDFAGIVYQPMEDGGRAAVARELADAGFEINWEKASRWPCCRDQKTGE